MISRKETFVQGPFKRKQKTLSPSLCSIRPPKVRGKKLKLCLFFRTFRGVNSNCHPLRHPVHLYYHFQLQTNFTKFAIIIQVSVEKVQQTQKTKRKPRFFDRTLRLLTTWSLQWKTITNSCFPAKIGQSLSSYLLLFSMAALRLSEDCLSRGKSK